MFEAAAGRNSVLPRPPTEKCFRGAVVVKPRLLEERELEGRSGRCRWCSTDYCTKHERFIAGKNDYICLRYRCHQTQLLSHKTVRLPWVTQVTFTFYCAMRHRSRHNGRAGSQDSCFCFLVALRILKMCS